MAGVCRPCEVALMTLGAVLIGQLIVVVRVTIAACDRRMMSRQGECRGRMVELGTGPPGRRMAALTVLAETACCMSWVCGAGVV